MVFRATKVLNILLAIYIQLVYFALVVMVYILLKLIILEVNILTVHIIIILVVYVVSYVYYENNNICVQYMYTYRLIMP